MANRVVIDAVNGLKVSKPGFNVLTAAPGNMIFDGSSITLKLHMEGITAPLPGSGTLSIPYGKTFNNVPLVATSWYNASDPFWFQRGHRWQNAAQYDLLTTDEYYRTMVAVPGSASLVFASSSVFAGERFRYIIWDLDI